MYVRYETMRCNVDTVSHQVDIIIIIIIRWILDVESACPLLIICSQFICVFETVHLCASAFTLHWQFSMT